MTIATDLLWWDDEDGCTLVWAGHLLRVYHDSGWSWKRQFAGGVWHMGDVLHLTREAATQAAVDAAEAVGVDFSQAPRWEDGEFWFFHLSAIADESGLWFCRDRSSGRREAGVSGQAPTESLARTAAIAAMRREVQKIVEKAKWELGV